MPESAGIAIGLDRVLMCRMQVDDIKQVIAFPWELA
jgi:lysyl-tRNA synthetase class 2